MLPPRVEIELGDTVRTYWNARVAQHLNDSYLGVPLLKFPEDLRVYEHLLWESRANVVIEIGTNLGGSACGSAIGWRHSRATVEFASRS
jgi:cephalosporin hydroxylase